MWLFNKKPRKYCETHGCELEDGVSVWGAKFDPDTGIGWAWSQRYRKCTSGDHRKWEPYNYWNDNRWYYGPKTKVPATKDCG